MRKCGTVSGVFANTTLAVWRVVGVDVILCSWAGCGREGYKAGYSRAGYSRVRVQQGRASAPLPPSLSVAECGISINISVFLS